MEKLLREVLTLLTTELQTGEIEVNIDKFEILGTCKELTNACI